MDRSRNETVDLLEIYHARALRDQLLANLRRLHAVEPFMAGLDEGRRGEIREFYELMLVTSSELLEQLGDHV